MCYLSNNLSKLINPSFLNGVFLLTIKEVKVIQTFKKGIHILSIKLSLYKDMSKPLQWRKKTLPMELFLFKRNFTFSKRKIKTKVTKQRKNVEIKDSFLYLKFIYRIQATKYIKAVISTFNFFNVLSLMF